MDELTDDGVIGPTHRDLYVQVKLSQQMLDDNRRLVIWLSGAVFIVISSLFAFLWAAHLTQNDHWLETRKEIVKGQAEIRRELLYSVERHEDRHHLPGHNNP